MANKLEFEESIQNLEAQILNYQAFCQKNGQDSQVADTLYGEMLPRVKEKIISNLCAWDMVQLARHPDRPHPTDYVKMIFTDLLELHGDRRFADDSAIAGGFARLDGRPVMVISTRKGRNLKQNIDCHFGSAHPEGYRKAQRLMRMANKAGCPIICIVDTPGAYPGVTAEERHIGEAIAECIKESFSWKVPFISVITGEGGSGGALALCTANRLIVMEYSYYSVITPEGCSAILWRNSEATPQAADALKLTSHDLLRMGVADAVVTEPLGGAQLNPAEAARNLKAELLKQLAELDSLTPDTLCQKRYEKFRAMGVVGGDLPVADFRIRPAVEADISFIHAFFLPFVLRRQILPRTESDIREHLQNFLVALTSDGKIVGTVALRDYGDGLQEIRSLAVSSRFDGHGLGSRLIKAVMELAAQRQAKRIFTLTIRPGIFKRLGFRPVSMMQFPQKVQSDCLQCPKKEQCDEVALLLEVP